MLVPRFPDPLAELPAEVDLAIVGAGAAGIAAARFALARGRRVVLLEAKDCVGGRAVTAVFGGHPVDLGAHWLHAGDVNPLVRIGLERGEPVRRSESGSHVVRNGRPVGQAERRDLARGFEQVDRAIARAAAGPSDSSIAAALPPLGRWRAALADTFALISGRRLDEVSARDFPSDEFGSNWFVRGGYGALLFRLGLGLPVALRTPVRSIAWGRDGVELRTPRGLVRAGAALVTVPMPVLARGAVAFEPGLPAGLRDAVESFRPGIYEHVVLNWPGLPLPGRDRLVKLIGRGPGAIGGMMARMDGAPFHYMEFGQRDVEAAGGRDRLARLARRALAEHFGPRALDRVRILHVTDWLHDPWALCSWAVLPPGRVESRAALAQSPADRLFFAGEANSGAMWGTVGGAWEEGERAAARALDRLSRVPAVTKRP